MEPTLSTPLHPFVGKVLNERYEVTGLLGIGGMASVFRARDCVLGRDVAIKVLHSRFVGDANFVARFQREAESAASLTGHPNVVSIFDVAHEADVHYIVMELIEGRDLKQVIEQEGPLPAERALRIASDIAAALAFTHSHGLIHRDIKPQNVLLLPDDRAKVTDFGLVRDSAVTPATRAGVIMGTPHYLAPEQILGKGSDGRSDLYGLGVVLYEMLTGTVPFDGDDRFGIAMRHVHEPPIALQERNPSLSPAISDFVLRALAKAPADRYHDAQSMVEALSRLDVSEPAPVRTMQQPLPGGWGARPILDTPTMLLASPGRSATRWPAHIFPTLMAAAALAGVLAALGLGVEARLTRSHTPAQHTPIIATRPPPARRAATCQGRSAAGISLLAATVTQSEVRAGTADMVRYTIDNRGSCRRLYLGATAISDTLRSFSWSDPGHAAVIRAEPGVHGYRRELLFPPAAAGQTFDLLVSVSIPSGPRVATYPRLSGALSVRP